MTPVTTVDVDDVPEGALLVDVREPRERAVSRIAGSVDLDGLEGMADALGDRPVVFWCTVGYRSHKVAVDWQARGVDARNLRGGILAWTHAERPLETPDGTPTRRVHTYDRWWALQPRAYEPVW